jgi:hypothetical protein
VNASLYVPTCEIAAIGPRESAGAEASDGRTLPEAVVKMRRRESGLFCAGVRERQPDGALPCSRRDFVLTPCCGRRQEKKREEADSQYGRKFHEVSRDLPRANAPFTRKRTGDDLADSIENRYFNKDLNGWGCPKEEILKAFSSSLRVEGESLGQPFELALDYLFGVVGYWVNGPGRSVELG